VKREFIRLPQFEANWKACGFTEDDIVELEDVLCKNPQIGPIIKRTGGLRKFRWKRANTGKSGGARVTYVDIVIHERIYLISAYNKSDKGNLTNKEKNEIKRIIDLLKEESNRKK